jgi:UDP-GlcNAc:undecaprenyl-phosphate GlcNAc-1-phosphate transferase
MISPALVLAAVFVLACGLSLLANWTARGLARRIGLVDRPDGHRKLQTQAIPLAGGIAIFAVVILMIGGLVVFDHGRWSVVVWSHGPLALGVLLAGTIILVLGVLDDWVGLRGRQKLAGQILAASVLVASGLWVERVSILGWNLELGIFSGPVAVVWLVGAMNALNLLDGIDGLAGTIGLVLCIALAVMASITQHATIALVATIMAGSLIGFLRFNLPPASMYLGDAGSMLIGLAVGVMAIRASLKGPGTVLLAVPLALWTLPLFDTAAAILRRKLTGRSIYDTDRAHLHHHLVHRLGHGMTLVCVAAVSLVTSIAALLSVMWKRDAIAIVCGVLVVLIFVSLKVFGHSELVLAAVRARSFLRSLFVARPSQMLSGWQDAIRLQGTRPWGLLWDALTESASRLDFVHLRLDVNVPLLGEGYHAAWNRPAGSQHNRHWRIDLPLMAQGRVLGHLHAVGICSHGAGRNLEELTELVGEVESHLARLVQPETSSLPAPHVPVPSDASTAETVTEMDSYVAPLVKPAQ